MTRHQLVVEWPTATTSKLNTHFYEGISAVVYHPEVSPGVSRVTLVGALDQLALWTLLEYTDTDLHAAQDVLATVTELPAAAVGGCCGRCGNREMARVQVTLCEDCDYEVTSSQAQTIANVKAMNDRIRQAETGIAFLPGGGH